MVRTFKHLFVFTVGPVFSLKCEVLRLHFYPLRFSLSVFSVFGEPRGSCKKSHCPCPRFLLLSLVIVFRVCVFRARTERLVTDPTHGSAFPGRVLIHHFPGLPPLWREQNLRMRCPRCWTSGQGISPAVPSHRINQNTGGRQAPGWKSSEP